MTTDVVSVAPNTTYAEAAKRMHDNKLASLPVVDTSGALVGMLSEKDLFRAMYPAYSEYYERPESVVDEEAFENTVDELRDEPVRKYMTQYVLSVSPDEPIMKVGSLMLTSHVHHVPVVESGKLVGVISRENVFSAILKSHLGF